MVPWISFFLYFSSICQSRMNQCVSVCPAVDLGREFSFFRYDYRGLQFSTTFLDKDLWRSLFMSARYWWFEQQDTKRFAVASIAMQWRQSCVGDLIGFPSYFLFFSYFYWKKEKSDLIKSFPLSFSNYFISWSVLRRFGAFVEHFFTSFLEEYDYIIYIYFLSLSNYLSLFIYLKQINLYKI